MTSFGWPQAFPRVPDEDWTHASVDALAERYDTVEKHGWYDNLDPTVATLEGLLQDGTLWIDYSGGTGILIDRLLQAAPERAFGVVNVDSSPKFLALSLRKFRDEPRVAFRLIRYLKPEGRLQYVDEVLGDALVGRGIDVLTSTNAIHLYYDLDGTLASWARVLRPGGRVHVQSGNVRNPDAAEGAWIIDDTVEVVHRHAMDIVREDDAYAAYREGLADEARMEKYDALRAKFFLPARPVATYTSALEAAGFRVLDVRTQAVNASVDEWLEFLQVYHEGVLGWVGGSERIDGRPPAPQSVEDRKRLMRLAMERIFDGRDAFDATWTYLDAERA